MKVFCAAFMCLQFGFVIFWQKDFGAKAVNKMLVKLTPERNRQRRKKLTMLPPCSAAPEAGEALGQLATI